MARRPGPRPWGILGSAVLAGCASLPGLSGAGKRLAADLFVIGSAPLQIPAMAARDAWTEVRDPWLRPVALPVKFVGRALLHTGLTLLHGVDLVALPLHVFRECEPVRIYEAYSLPMAFAPEAAIATEAGEIALWSAGAVGGVAVGYYFFGVYVPAVLGL